MAIERNFQKYTYKYLINDALSLVDDSFDKREGSIIYDALAPFCQELALAYDNLNYAITQCFGTQAVGDNLSELAMSIGISRIEGVSPTIVFKFMDSSGTVIPSSNPDTWLGKTFYFKMSDGVNWKFTIQTYFTYSSATVFTCVSDRVGLYSDLKSLMLSETIYSDDLQIAQYTTYTTLDQCNLGSAEETDDALRKRYLKYICYNRFGGNFTDYTLLPEISDTLSPGSVVYNTEECNYEWLMGVMRGTQCKVYMFLVKKITTPDGSIYFVEPTSTELSNIGNELCPSSSTGGGGLVPIGHELYVSSVGFFSGNSKESATFTITGNTLDATIIANELAEVAHEYSVERNEDELLTRKADGTYAPYTWGYSDVVTVWGRAYREGYGTLSSISCSVNGNTYTDLTGRCSVARTYPSFYLYNTEWTITVSAS